MDRPYIFHELTNAVCHILLAQSRRQDSVSE